MRLRSVPPRRRLPAVAAPIVDALEGRTLLSAVLLPDGTLQVTGTAAADQYTLRRGIEANKLNVEEGRTTLFVFLADRVHRIEIDLGAGDDTVNVDTSRGLVTGAGDATVHVNGGDGNDALFVFGAPPAGGSDQTLAVGPDAGAGTLVTRAGTETQTVTFSTLESLADTSIATTFTLAGNDGANVVELAAGPLAGGVTPMATARFYDVSPCPLVTPAPQASTPGPAAPATSPTFTTTTPAAAAVDARDPESRREAKRQAKAAKREAQRAAREAKRLARLQKRSASRQPATAAVTPAPAAPAGGAWVIDRAYLAVQFANKSAVVVAAGAGDDRVDVNLAAPPAGLQSLTVDGAAGNDRVCEQALSAGVALQKPGVETSSAVRDFDLMAECPAPYVPEVPGEAPPPLPEVVGGGAASSAATSSRDRAATSSRDKDAGKSKDRDASASSKDRDSNSSRDHNASNGD